MRACGEQQYCCQPDGSRYCCENDRVPRFRILNVLVATVLPDTSSADSSSAASTLVLGGSAISPLPSPTSASSQTVSSTSIIITPSTPQPFPSSNPSQQMSPTTANTIPSSTSFPSPSPASPIPTPSNHKSPPNSKQEKTTQGLVAGLGLTAFIIILSGIALGIYVRKKKKQRQKSSKNDRSKSSVQDVPPAQIPSLVETNGYTEWEMATDRNVHEAPVPAVWALAESGRGRRSRLAFF